MNFDQKLNENPEIFGKVKGARDDTEDEENEDITDPFDTTEIYELIRDISDPEVRLAQRMRLMSVGWLLLIYTLLAQHPHSLEELKVMQPDGVTIRKDGTSIDIFFTPTIPHCSMSTLIG